MVKEVPDLPSRRPRRDVAGHARSSSTGTRRATSPSPIPPAPAPRRTAGAKRMIESLLANLETLLLYLFAALRARRRGADAGAAPPDARGDGADLDDGVPGRRLRPARRALHRRVPGADLRRRGDGVHGLRDHAARRARPRRSRAASRGLLVPGRHRRVALFAVFGWALWHDCRRRRRRRRRRAVRPRSSSRSPSSTSTGCTSSSTSVLLVAAVVAALAVHRSEPEATMDKVQLLQSLARRAVRAGARSASSSGATCW